MEAISVGFSELSLSQGLPNSRWFKYMISLVMRNPIVHLVPITTGFFAGIVVMIVLDLYISFCG